MLSFFFFQHFVSRGVGLQGQLTLGGPIVSNPGLIVSNPDLLLVTLKDLIEKMPEKLVACTRLHGWFVLCFFCVSDPDAKFSSRVGLFSSLTMLCLRSRSKLFRFSAHSARVRPKELCRIS